MVLVTLSKLPVLSTRLPPAAFRPLMPRTWSIASVCCVCAALPLALELATNLISLPRSTNQTTWESEPSFFSNWTYDSLPASASSRPCACASMSFTRSTSLPTKNVLPSWVQTTGGSGRSALAFSLSLSLSLSSLGRGGGWITWRVAFLKDSDVTLAPESLLCSVARLRTSVIIEVFLPASAVSTSDSGSLGSSRLTIATETVPWGSSKSSRYVTPSLLLSDLLDSSIRSARSSFQAFRPGSFQSWPNWLCRNDSRSAAAFLIFRKAIVASGRTFSGGVAAQPWAATSDRPARPSQPARARRKAARIGVRIAEDSVSIIRIFQSSPPSHRRRDLAKHPSARRASRGTFQPTRPQDLHLQCP